MNNTELNIKIGTTPKPTKFCGICASVYKYAWTKKIHSFIQTVWANEKHVKHRLLNPWHFSYTSIK